MNINKCRFAFFGGEPLAVTVLEELMVGGWQPSLVVANPDRPAGRGQKLTPPPVKVWARARQIPVWQPTTLTPDAPALAGPWDVFIVAAFNKILPTWLLELPTHQTINVHPSLLPKLRGASPIRSAILRDEPEHLGVSIIVLDEKIDHGPILTSQKLEIDPKKWPLAGPELDTGLAHLGGAVLTDLLPRYLAGAVTPTSQAHEKATYCGRLEKAQAKLTLNPYQLPVGEPARVAFRTIQAFAGLGNAWFTHNGERYKITKAGLDGERLVIETVVPAGQKATPFARLFA